MSDSSLAAAASAAEEWSDAEFDLPDGPSLIQHIEETIYTGRGTSGHLSSHQSQLPQFNTKPSRPTYLRMSTGPEDIEEEDDTAAFLEEKGDAAPMSGPITRFFGSLAAKSRGTNATPRVGVEDEDWETDLDFVPSSRLGGFKLPPVAFAPPIREDSTWVEQDDEVDVSTIKLSRLPRAPASSESADTKPAPENAPLSSSSPSISSTLATMGKYENDDDSMESAFELPATLSKLALRPLSHHASKATLSTLSEWASDATTTTATSATSEFFESDGRPGHATLSASPSTDFTTDEEGDDDREAKEVEGLVLPESFLPKDLVRILDSKKKGFINTHPTTSTTSKSAPMPRSKHAEDEDDFEKGLLIGNDSELNPSRLLRNDGRAGVSSDAVASGVKSRLRPKLLTVPLNRAREPSVRASPSQVTLKRAKTTLAPPSSSSVTRDVKTNARSPSPQPRRSQESTTSSSAPSSKASVVTLRRTKTTSRVTSPPYSFARPTPPSQQATRPKESSPPPLSHSYSMLTLPRVPGLKAPNSPSKSMKHQKSTSRLLVSPKSLTPGQGGSGKDGAGPMRLGRKGSLCSLVDAEKARERISRERASKTSTLSSGSGSGSGTASASTSQAGSTGKTSALQRPPTSSGNISALPRYNAPTASSLAKMATPAGRPSLTSLFLPVPRSTTPIDSPTVSRLTMPTASTRAKARVPVTAVFPDQTQTISPPSRQSSTSPVPMARIASPSHLRPVLPAAKVGPKFMKKPKSARAFGDGTELDALDDLVVEKDKERRFRVTPKATSNGSRLITANNTKEKRPTVNNPTPVSSSATLGRRKTIVGVPTSTSTSASTSTVSGKRPSSRASELPRPTSAASTSTNGTGTSMTGTGTLPRRKSRMDFASSTATIVPSTSATMSMPKVNTIKSSVPLLAPAPAPAAYATLRRKRGSPKTETVTQRKPTLIRNLSGVGSPKVIGDMRWNPATMRWEGNDSALRGFDSPLYSARPALITQLTGSSMGGVGSPTSSLLSGARIVGNMIFDPTKMCWINRFADDEPDPFAGLDEDEDKDATLGKRGGTVFRARSNTGNLGAPSLGTPLETVAGSPARSAASRSSHRTHHSTTSESEAESVLRPLSSARSSMVYQDDEDDRDEVASGSAGIGSPERIRRAAMTRGASTSPVPGVDTAMVEACHIAEARHRAEMRGWFPRRRAVSSASRNTAQRRLGMLSDGVDDPDVLDRSYLYEIRTLATRQY